MEQKPSAFKAVLKFIKKSAPYIICTALIVLLVVFGVKYCAVIMNLIESQVARDAFVAWVQSKGALGFLAFLAVQILQVVVAIIPGEPIELMAGALYGTWGGLFVCELRLLLGSIAVYGFVKLAGAKSVPEETLSKYKFLRDEAHVEFALFMLYFIPGTLKDMLLYIGPFMPVSAKRFFILATIARVRVAINFVQTNGRAKRAPTNHAKKFTYDYKFPATSVGQWLCSCRSLRQTVAP